MVRIFSHALGAVTLSLCPRSRVRAPPLGLTPTTAHAVPVFPPHAWVCVHTFLPQPMDGCRSRGTRSCGSRRRPYAFTRDPHHAFTRSLPHAARVPSHTRSVHTGSSHVACTSTLGPGWGHFLTRYASSPPGRDPTHIDWSSHFILSPRNTCPSRGPGSFAS